MKIQDVKKQIFSTLELFASANGFKILKGRFALSRKVGSRTDEIFLTYCSWGFEINIFPYVSVDYGEITTIQTALFFQTMSMTTTIGLIWGCLHYFLLHWIFSLNMTVSIQ